MHSSRTTTTGAITRASTISPRPTSTSGAVKPSCWKEKGSNARPSKTVGCFTTNKPRNINHDAPDSLLLQVACCLKVSDDGQLECGGNSDAGALGSSPNHCRKASVLTDAMVCAPPTACRLAIVSSMPSGDFGRSALPAPDCWLVRRLCDAAECSEIASALIEINLAGSHSASR